MIQARTTLAIILTLILGLALTLEKAQVASQEATAQGQKKEGQPKLVPENLARGKKASASSQQDDARGPDKGVDGDFETRWCAANGVPTQWYQIDLGRPEELTGCRITWEFSGPGYGYRIEGSADGKQWSQLVDQSKGEMDAPSHNHAFTGAGIRYMSSSPPRGSRRASGPAFMSSKFSAPSLCLRKLRRRKRRPRGPRGSAT